MKISKIFATVFVSGILGLAACVALATPKFNEATQPPSTESLPNPTVVTAIETAKASGYPPPPPERFTQEAEFNTRIAEAYPGMFYTITPGPSPTFPPTFPPPPTVTPFPTITPSPTFVPAQLDVIQIEIVQGLADYPLQRLTGWSNGYRRLGETLCGATSQPFAWLGNTTLLAFPTTYIDRAGWNEEYTLPVIVHFAENTLWRFPTDYTHKYCNVPLWSSSLKQFILTQPNSVRLFNLQGEQTAQFAVDLPHEEDNSFLAPSGKHLLTGNIWRDLETGETYTMPQALHYRLPGWSQDERRLLFCCFMYWDIQTQQFQEFNFPELELPGRDGPPLNMIWVLNESRAFANIEFYRGSYPNQKVVVPLIDPVQQTYLDLATVLNLETGYRCGGPNVAPNQLYAISGCVFLRELDQPSRAVMFQLDDLAAIPLPAEYGFVNWSASGRFALLQKSWDRETNTGEFLLFNVEKAEAVPIIDGRIGAPVWAPIGEQAAFALLDGRAIIIVNLESNQIFQVDVGQPIKTIVWNPPATQLAVQMIDGSLWWIANPSENQITQLTPPLADVRDVAWSPSGSHLAFVSGSDIYVVQVTQP